MQARFDNGVYRDCKWCHGRGCLSCPAEADKEYKRQFPDGPKPILSVSFEDLDAMEISEATGGPGIVSAHGELGALLREVVETAKRRQP